MSYAENATTPRSIKFDRLVFNATIVELNKSNDSTLYQLYGNETLHQRDIVIYNALRAFVYDVYHVCFCYLATTCLLNAVLTIEIINNTRGGIVIFFSFQFF